MYSPAVGDEVADEKLGLVVTVDGDRLELVSPGPHSLGRAGDVCMGPDDPELHRVCVHLVARSALWWVDNVGSRLPVHLEGPGAGGWVVVKPGAAAPLLGEETLLGVATGQRLHLVTLHQTDWPQPAGGPTPPGQPTQHPPPLRLNGEQRQLLAGLAEPRLRDGSRTPLQTNATLAHRLGWSRKKLDGKLDYLCHQLDGRGVPGMRGDVGTLAHRRREILVDYVLARNLITDADVSALPPNSEDI